MNTLGIDIGGSSIKAALICDRGVFTAQSGGYENPDREMLSGAILACIDELRSRCPGVVGRGLPVGLCLPGRSSEDGGCIERSINLRCIEGWGFDRLLEGALGHVPVSHRVVSDVRAAAHDICVLDGRAGRLAVIAIGTGVGLAVLDDGEPLTIGGRSIGHLGQMDVGRLASHDLVAPDGAVNTLECYVGLRGLRSRLGGCDEGCVTESISGFAQDDPFMLAIVRAIRTMHAIYAPGRVCLVGGVGMLLASRGEAIKHAVDAGLTSLAQPGWSLCFGKSLFHACVGAARLASA